MAFSRKQKIWTILAGSLILIFLILVLIGNRIVSNIAEDQARKYIDKLDKEEYHIRFDKVRVNLFSGAINIYGIEVIPDTLALEKVRRSRLAKPLIELRIPRIRAGDVPFMGIVRDEVSEIGSISIRDAEVIIHAPFSMYKGTEHEPGEHENLFSGEMGESMEKAGLRELSLELALFRYIDESCGKVEAESRNAELNAEELRFIPGHTDALEVDDIRLEMDHCQMDLPGGFYRVSTGPLHASYSEQSISIDSFRLIPSYPKGEFGRKFGKQTDRFELHSGNIRLSGIVYDSLANNHLIVSSVEISNTQADIYRDKRIPRDMSIFPKLPQTALAELKMPVYIEEVKFLNAAIDYQEMTKDAPRPGHVLFEKTDLLIGGICNYPDSILKGQAIHARANTMIMGRAGATVYFYLPVGNQKEFFTYHGKISPFEGDLLDPMTMPLADIKAKEGRVNGISFYAMAMSDTAVGRIEFLYQDFKLDIRKKDKNDPGKTEENKFMSFIARTVLHKNNPKPGKDPRIGLMQFVRDPNKGFFNFIWKNIQNGLIVTLVPMPKYHAKDMNWEEFKAQWRKVLLQDYQNLQLENKPKESKEENK